MKRKDCRWAETYFPMKRKACRWVETYFPEERKTCSEGDCIFRNFFHFLKHCSTLLRLKLIPPFQGLLTLTFFSLGFTQCY